MAKLLHIIFDAHLGNGHEGLGNIAMKKRIALNTLGAGDCVLFINRKQNALKMFAGCGELLLHYKTKHGGALNAEVLRHLPNYIEGGQLNYGAALKATLKKRLRKYEE